MKPLFSALAGAGALIVAPTLSAAAAVESMTVVRGTVLAIKPAAVTIATREGKTMTVGLMEGWSVQVTKPIAVDAIQAGSFIGTAEMPQADGSGRSLEVHVFPPGVKAGEGHYAWNLRRGSMMTNGTVGKVTSGAKGRELEVSYTTGSRKIVVPPKVPIVLIGPGDRSMVKAGSKVVLMLPPAGAGPLLTRNIAVGEGGRAPPF